jgi:hypothetical protein
MNLTTPPFDHKRFSDRVKETLENFVITNTEKYRLCDFSDRTSCDIYAIHQICFSECENVLKCLPNNHLGVFDALYRFSDGLFRTLNHLLDNKNLTRTAFKNLIDPMATLIYTISRLSGQDDRVLFAFGTNQLDFNAEGRKITFKDPEKHRDLINRVHQSSQEGRGCPMRHVNLEVDLDGTGKKTVNIIKALYYLCARQVEMALFGCKTDTPA